MTLNSVTATRYVAAKLPGAIIYAARHVHTFGPDAPAVYVVGVDTDGRRFTFACWLEDGRIYGEW